MVGGPSSALERVRPFLEAYSKTITHVGEAPGSGQTAKAVNQALVVLNQLAASEALLLAQGAGLDLKQTLAARRSGQRCGRPGSTQRRARPRSRGRPLLP